MKRNHRFTALALLAVLLLAIALPVLAAAAVPEPTRSCSYQARSPETEREREKRLRRKAAEPPTATAKRNAIVYAGPERANMVGRVSEDEVLQLRAYAKNERWVQVFYGGWKSLGWIEARHLQ